MPGGGAQPLIEDARERVRTVEMRRLRELPLDERKLARAAAKHRQHFAVGLRLPPRVFAEAIEAEREDRRAARRRPRRSVGVQADEEIGFVVVGDRGAAVGVDAVVASCVSSTRMPRRPSMAPLTRRATASVTSFSTRAARPFTPMSSPPCPGSITIVRIVGRVAPPKTGNGVAGVRRRRGVRGGRWRGGADSAAAQSSTVTARRPRRSRRAATRGTS